jgi:hypothetical protein
MGKYHHQERSTSAQVWFKTLDGGGTVLKDYPGAACYAQIIAKSYDEDYVKKYPYYANYGMHKDTKIIHVYRSKKDMPYDVPEIKRWIDDLNELGFPCRFANDDVEGDDTKQEKWAKETIKKDVRAIALRFIRQGAAAPVDPNKFYNFFVDIKDYDNKTHLFSTLTLIRMLSENYYDKVPELYFEMLDKDPKMDKLQAIQDAHKATNTNGGHCVTYSGNGSNVTRDKLFKRFEKKNDIWEGTININECWKG